MAVIHNFREHLKTSQLPRFRRRFKQMYCTIWPDVDCGPWWIDEDQEYQHRGIDVLVSPRSMRNVIRIDEKVRLATDRYSYDDLLVEYWSDVEYATPGWTVNPIKCSDFIAYAIEAAASCRLIASGRLREIAVRHQSEWLQAAGGRWRDVENRDGDREWTTRNIPVSWRAVSRLLGEGNCVRYDW